MHSGKKSNQSFAFKNERLSMDRRSDNKPGHARRQTNSVNDSNKSKPVIKDKYAELVGKQRKRDARIAQLRKEKEAKQEAEELSHIKPRFNQKAPRERAEEVGCRFEKYANDYKHKRERYKQRREDEFECQKRQWFRPKTNKRKNADPSR